jgi:hypothetical protein
MSLPALQLENSLVAYLRPMLSGVAIHPGHSNEEQSALPRVIFSATSAGGDLSIGAGVDEIEIEITIITAIGSVNGDPDPVQTISMLAETIREKLGLDQIDTLATILSFQAPPLVLSGLEYEGQREGRDTQRAIHGLMLDYRAWVA